MPDVGVLNLTIKDNSEQAVKGLEALDDVLLRIRHVVSGALGLGKVANEIKRIGRAVEENLTDSTLTKIGQLATELSKLQGLGSLNIKINGGTSIESIRDAVRETMQDMGAINTGFDDVKSRAYDAKAGIDGINSSIRDTQQLMQNTAWTGGLNQFREMFEEYSRIRSALSLPAGEQTGISTDVEKGWTAWKDGAIEVEGTVSEAMDTVIGYLEQPGGYLTGIVSDLNNVNSGLHSTKDAVDGVAGAAGSAKAAVASTLKEFEHLEKNGMFRSYMYGPRNDIESTDTTGFMKGYETEEERMAMNPQWYQSIVQAEEGYERVAEAADKAAPSVQNFTNTMEQAANQNANADMSFIDNLISKSSEVDLLNMKIESLTDRLYEGASSGKMTGEQIADMIARIRKLRDEIENLQTTTYGMSSAWDSFKAGMKRMFPTITSLLGRFKQLVKYRMLRSVLRHITSGFSEGIQNVYNYSKAVGTSLAPAMDQAATVLQQMKNSVGAAVAPLIQSLVPVLQTVVNWFITAMNYANQFFALMRGQTSWTRALPEQAEAFEKSSKSAKNASKAMKDLLADWDELNIIQSQGSDGSGSSTAKTAEEYSQMFEEVNEFNDRIQNAVSFIEDHLGGMSELLKKVGLMLLGWKFSRAFTGVLGTLGKLVAGGAMIVLGVELSYGGGFNAGSKGFFNGDDLLSSIGGTLATAIGGSIITSAVGLGTGVGLVIGLGVGVVATLVGWIEGQADFMDRMKWGNKTMTPDEIQAYVKSKFTFDVEAEITILDNNIKDRETAKTNLEKEINDFVSTFTLAKVKVGIAADDSENAIKEAYENSQSALQKFQEYIDTNEVLLINTLKIAPIRDENGEDLTKDIIANVSIADTTLKDYMLNLGKELADAMAEGERLGWEGNTQQNIIALMEREKKIIDAQKEYERDLEFYTRYKQGLSGFTRDTAKDIIENERVLIEEEKEKFLADRQGTGEAYRKLLATTMAAIDDAIEQGEDTSKLEAAKKVYQDLMNEYLDPDKAEEEWKKKINQTMANMKEDWIKALTDTYGDLDSEFVEQRNPILFTPVNSVFTNVLYDSAKSDDPIGSAKKALNDYFDSLKKQMPDYIQDMMNTLDMSVWDYADDEFKQNLVKVLRNALGDDYAAAVLQSAQIPLDEVEKLFGDGYKFDPNKLDPTGLKKNRNLRPWWDIAGITFMPPDDEQEAIVENAIDDLYKSVLDYSKEYEGTTDAIVLPVDIWITNADEAMELLKEDITAAVEDGVLDYEELQNLVEKYHSDKMLEEALKELQITLNDEGYLTGDNARKAMRHMASMGMSDVGWGNGTYYPSGDNQPLTDQDISGDVETGVKAGNVEQNALLEQMITLLGRIAGKELVVNFTPSSSMGAVVGASTALFGRVTGNG